MRPSYSDYKQAKNAPLLMAIINATPDSFSRDGVIDTSHDDILQLVEQRIIEGADIIDIGAESTRPGATPINAEEEGARLYPILQKIRHAFPHIYISVDTYKAAIAHEAIMLGADIINDVHGLKEHDMAKVACNAKAYIGMVNLAEQHLFTQHNHIGTMYADYAMQHDIVTEMQQLLQNLRDTCLQHGLKAENVILDPGFGFGIAPHHSLALLQQFKSLQHIGQDLLIGISRKSLFGRLMNLPLDERDNAAITLHLHAAAHGAAILRTHAIKPLKQALTMQQLLHNNAKQLVMVALGGNMGETTVYFEEAFAKIATIATIKAKSKIYTTKPMYEENQADFTNMVIAIETYLEPEALLQFLKTCEIEAGRNMQAKRNSARPLDLDIITYGTLTWQSDVLSIPHPHLHERPFVLEPLMDINPYHPIAGTPYVVKDYWQKLQKQ